MQELEQEKFTYHLTELRKTLLSIIFCLLILFPLGYYLAPYCMNFLIKWSFPPQLSKLNFFSPMEVFLVNLKIGFIISFIIGFPYIMYKVWKFLLPALYEKERKFLKIAVFVSSFLFVCGVSICIAFVLPLLINFSMSFATDKIQPILGINNFIGLSFWLMLAFGLMFQFPIVIFFLVKFSIVSIESLTNKRPYIITIILILSAILTPPDIVSQLMLAIPTYISFELGIIFIKLQNKI